MQNRARVHANKISRAAVTSARNRARLPRRLASGAVAHLHGPSGNLTHVTAFSSQPTTSNLPLERKST